MAEIALWKRLVGWGIAVAIFGVFVLSIPIALSTALIRWPLSDPEVVEGIRETLLFLLVIVSAILSIIAMAEWGPGRYFDG